MLDQELWSLASKGLSVPTIKIKCSHRSKIKEKKRRQTPLPSSPPSNVLNVCLKVNGQMCIKGQIPHVATQFCCNPAIAANKRSVGRKETTKKLPYEMACSFKTEWKKMLLHRTYQKWQQTGKISLQPYL